MGTLTGEKIVSLTDMAIGYAPDRVLLQGINLTVMPGEMVALAGRNGSGKSTLLKSLLGFLPIQEGDCQLFGMSPVTLDVRKRARMVSYVSSRVPPMPSMSVRELVALGRMPHTGWTGRLDASDRERVMKSLKEMGMEGFSDRKVDELSDGERHKAMIARAMAQDTSLMVLDEPTAFLDIPNKYALIRILGRYRDSGRSVVYSTHDLESAWLWADKFWVIHRGRILEGAPEDLGIRHVFEELFEDSAITFDPSGRRFIPQLANRGTVGLEGESSEVLHWTRIALERMGFRISENPVSTTILVSGSAGDHRWRLVSEREEETFPDIYSLARYLIKAK